MSKRILYQLLPDPYTDEGDRRFRHADLLRRHLNFDTVWAERHLIERRLADLIHVKSDGRFLISLHGEPVFEKQWLAERLSRLQAVQRRSAA